MIYLMIKTSGHGLRLEKIFGLKIILNLEHFGIEFISNFGRKNKLKKIR